MKKRAVADRKSRPPKASVAAGSATRAQGSEIRLTAGATGPTSPEVVVYVLGRDSTGETAAERAFPLLEQ